MEFNEFDDLWKLDQLNSFDFYSSAPFDTELWLLQLEDEKFDLQSLTAELTSPDSSFQQPLPRFGDLCRFADAAHEQSFGSFISGGCSISRPAVQEGLVVFGTEDTSSNCGNLLFMVDSIFSSIGDTRYIPVSGAVTAVSFISIDGLVAFGVPGGEALLVQAAGGYNLPIPLALGHSDDIRDFTNSHGSYFASCSYDGLVVVSDLMHGCTPFLMMDLETEVSSVCECSRNIISATADCGFVIVRDLRVGRNNSGQFEQKIAISGSTLVDHCWSARDDQVILACQDGTLACIDTRMGRTISSYKSSDNLDSIDFELSSSTLAASGNGVTFLTFKSGVLKENVRYVPKSDRTFGNAGVFNQQGQFYVTAPNQSLVMLNSYK